MLGLDVTGLDRLTARIEERNDLRDEMGALDRGNEPRQVSEERLV